MPWLSSSARLTEWALHTVVAVGLVVGIAAVVVGWHCTVAAGCTFVAVGFGPAAGIDFDSVAGIDFVESSFAGWVAACQAVAYYYYTAFADWAVAAAYYCTAFAVADIAAAFLVVAAPPCYCWMGLADQAGNNLLPFAAAAVEAVASC